MQITPEIAQEVISALSNQRNAALNQLAVAEAQNTRLLRALEQAQKELAELKPKDDDAESKVSAGRKMGPRPVQVERGPDPVEATA